MLIAREPLFLCDYAPPLSCCATSWLSLQVKKQKNKKIILCFCLPAEHDENGGREIHLPSHSGKVSVPTLPRAAQLFQRPDDGAAGCQGYDDVTAAQLAASDSFKSQWGLFMRILECAWCDATLDDCRLKSGTIRSSVCIMYNMTCDLMLINRFSYQWSTKEILKCVLGTELSGKTSSRSEHIARAKWKNNMVVFVWFLSFQTCLDFAIYHSVSS